MAKAENGNFFFKKNREVQDREPKVLTKEQVQSYHEKGYLFLEGVLPTNEALSLGHELKGLIESRGQHNVLWEGKFVTQEERSRLQIKHLHGAEKYSPRFGQLLYDPRILEPVSQLIGPDIELHHSKGFVKPPEAGGLFPMHQDYPYYPHENNDILAAIVHLSPATKDMGCVTVYPSSHKNGPLPVSPDGLYLPTDEWPPEQAIPMPAKPGDVLLFSYLTVHGSGPNVSNEPRINQILQLRSSHNHPTTHVPEFAQGLQLRGKKIPA